jgi:hypothetical protein
MKITKQQLKKIIKEELAQTISEDDDRIPPRFSPSFEEAGARDIVKTGGYGDPGEVESGYAEPLRQIQEDIAEILDILRAGGSSY